MFFPAHLDFRCQFEGQHIPCAYRAVPAYVRESAAELLHARVPFYPAFFYAVDLDDEWPGFGDAARKPVLRDEVIGNDGRVIQGVLDEDAVLLHYRVFAYGSLEHDTAGKRSELPRRELLPHGFSGPFGPEAYYGNSGYTFYIIRDVEVCQSPYKSRVGAEVETSSGQRGNQDVHFPDDFILISVRTFLVSSVKSPFIIQA